MGLFGPTVRDFSKSEEGRKCLEALFDYEALPKPNLTRVLGSPDLAKDILGRAFEYLLQLLIERQNPDFRFEFPFKRKFRDARAKEARAVKHYFESGELTDYLLGCLVSLAKERQKAFKMTPSRSKRVVQDGLKIELRRIHDLASVLKWSIEDFFYRGWLTDGRLFTAEGDLLIDTALIEVKTTEDARRHIEHESQLFAYFLLTQAPTKKPKPFVINELGIYYARHGVLVKESVSKFLRFPLNRAPRVAFDFWVEFSRWRTRKSRGENNESDAKVVNNYAMLEVVQELHPRPEWVARILANPYKKIKRRSGSCVTPRQISVPEDFLLQN